MNLTKANIVESIATKTDFTGKQAGETVEFLLEIVKRALETGEDVLISGFGKFCIKEKKERKGRNPATGDHLMLKPSKVVTFRCSRKLREELNRT